MSWVCPHCGTTATLQTSDVNRDWVSVIIQTAPETDGIAIGWLAVRCPNRKCQKFVLDIQVRLGQVKKTSYNDRVAPDLERPIGIGDVRIEPRVGLPLSIYVPKVVHQDYEEAYLIKDLSPKASATLCRRALQGMVRDFWGVTRATLHDELAVIKSKCDLDLFDAMMGLKSIGNIGAHPEKDINLIIDVEDGEPDALLELIRILDKEWYVARADRLTRLTTVKQLGADKAAAKAAGVVGAAP